MLAGAKSVTVGTDVFGKIDLSQSLYRWSMEKFESDWANVYGDKNLSDLI